MFLFYLFVPLAQQERFYMTGTEAALPMLLCMYKYIVRILMYTPATNPNHHNYTHFPYFNCNLILKPSLTLQTAL